MTNPEIESRDGFSFRGDHVALDLCATLTGRAKAAPNDLLATPRDLARWLKAAAVTSSPVAPSPQELELARRLREAIYALAIARVAGKGAPAVARAELNACAEKDAAIPRLSEDWHIRVTASPRAMLAGMAQDAIRLLAGPHAERIRQCEGETCSRLFIDNSRAGDRRWCSMAACGNRAKVAEFRRRKRAS